MKNKIILTILYFSTLAGYVFAQNPGFNYQAVLRNDAGEPMTNAEVTLHFSLIDGPTSTVIYKENQTLTTNELGILTCMIGSGTVESGTFEEITGVQDLNIKIEAKLLGETGMTEIGESPIGIIPYALYGKDEDADPDNEMQELSLVGDSLMISGAKGTSLEKIRSRWKLLDGGTGYTFRLNEASLARNLEGQTVIEEIKFNSISEAPIFVKTIVDFLIKVRGGFPTSNETVVTNYLSTLNDVIVRDRYFVGRGYELNRISTSTVKVIYSELTQDGPPMGQEMTIQLDEAGEKILNISERNLTPTKSAIAISNILNENGSCETANTTTLGLDGLKKECSFESTSAERCSLITATENGETQYTCTYTASGDIVQAFNNGATCTSGPGGWQYTSTNGVLCEAGEISEGIGACATYASGVPTTISSATPGSNSGFCLTLNENQISTSCTATSQGYGDCSLFNSSGATTVRTSGIEGFGGVILVNDDTGNEKIRLGCDQTGKAGIWFEGEQVLGPTTAIQRAKITDEGSITLLNGEATVFCSHAFIKMADPNKMIVHLTPGSADSKGLAVVEKFAGGFKVKELYGGSGNYPLDWQVSSKINEETNRQTLPAIPETALMKDSGFLHNLPQIR